MTNEQSTLDALVGTLQQEFDQLRASQWEKGESEYGHLAFMEKLTSPELFRYLYEELADASNYCMALYIKLRAMEIASEARTDQSSSSPEEDAEHPVPFGTPGFNPKSGVSGFLPRGGGLQNPGQRGG